MNKAIKVLEWIIFVGSKILLIPFYLKLFVTLVRLGYHFIVQGEVSNSDLISTLEDVDVVMIANLVKMIIVGSYHSFVSKLHGYADDASLTSGILKIKISTSVIGVTTIHLLQSFLNSENLTNDAIYKQLLMLASFIVGALALAYIDHLHCKIEKH
jgi:uncharacterized protein (TIGR00645 family)